MALNLAELLSIARGETEAENGRNGVSRRNATPSVTPKKPGVTPVTPATPQICKVGKDVFGGVAEGVSAAWPSPAFDPEALQADADDRNREAAREGRTDRFCACGRLATLAWPEGNRREVWRCDDCADAAGRA
jgi:hypothetical protein